MASLDVVVSSARISIYNYFTWRWR